MDFWNFRYNYLYEIYNYENLTYKGNIPKNISSEKYTVLRKYTITLEI